MTLDDLFKKYEDKKILDTGILKPSTLKAYRGGQRVPRPVTIIAVAQALGEKLENVL